MTTKPKKTTSPNKEPPRRNRIPKFKAKGPDRRLKEIENVRGRMRSRTPSWTRSHVPPLGQRYEREREVQRK